LGIVAALRNKNTRRRDKFGQYSKQKVRVKKILASPMKSFATRAGAGRKATCNRMQPCVWLRTDGSLAWLMTTAPARRRRTAAFISTPRRGISKWEGVLPL